MPYHRKEHEENYFERYEKLKSWQYWSKEQEKRLISIIGQELFDTLDKMSKEKHALP